MGVNHFDTPYKLWRRKTGIDLPIEQNEAMEMGSNLNMLRMGRILIRGKLVHGITEKSCVNVARNLV